LAVAVAGEDEMPDVVDEFVGQFGGRHALGAVTRTAERDQQRRGVGLQVVQRAGDDVGRRDRVDTAVEVPAERGGGDIAGERRAACSGQDHPEVGAVRDVAQEFGGALVVAGRDLPPGVGLLPDLENRCAAVFLGGNGGANHRPLQ
jgi:hypothetical protein